MRRFTIAAAALLFAGFAATPAFADTHTSARSVVVDYHDLNLSTTTGADAMIERLDRAARQVCRSAGRGYRGFAQYEARRECRESTVSAAVASLNAPVVTARFDSDGEAPIVTASAW